MPDRRRYGRTPDAVFMLALCAAIGTVQVITLHVPDSVLALVPLGVGVFWAGTFALSAAASLVALYWRDLADSWLIELAGRLVLAAAAAAYTYAIASSVAHPGSWLVVGFIAGIALASAARAWQIIRRLRQYRRDLEAAS